MSETRSDSPGFVTSVVFGVIAIAMGVGFGVANNAPLWGGATVCLGIAWIVYALWRRARAPKAPS